MVGGEVCEGAVGEGVASDGGVGVQEGVGVQRSEGILEVS